MGANLYIGSLIEPRQAKYRPQYEHWIRVRDRATSDGARLQAQFQINRYYDLMYAKGTFRDSYNESNLLEKFGLTWWKDVGPLLTSQGLLEPNQVQWLVQTLEERVLIFYTSIARNEDWADYLQRYRQLRTFLRYAVQRNEPIACSM